MWEAFKRAAWLSGLLGAALIWLSSNSIRERLASADSNLAANLKWAGMSHPPSALATTTADHWAGAIGGLLLIGWAYIVVVWLRKRWSPLKAVRLQKAADTPTAGQVALWLVIRNRSDRTLNDLSARLIDAEPELEAFPVQALPPFTLATKTRLERKRLLHQPLPAVGFTLRSRCDKQIEVAWLHEGNALEWHVEHEGGVATFLMNQTYVLVVEVGGVPHPLRVRIELVLVNEESGEWGAWLLRRGLFGWRRS